MSAYEVTIAGFGGQGILLIGQLLAYAANKAGKSVSWLPAYGPEMRGGTANCMVVVADAAVNSPYILKPSALIAMNKPSVERFEPALKPGGLLVINKDMVDQTSHRADLRIVEIWADSAAEQLGNSKIANMVALGAFIGASQIVTLEAAVQCLPNVIADHKAELLEPNSRALRFGYEYANRRKLGGGYDAGACRGSL